MRRTFTRPRRMRFVTALALGSIAYAAPPASAQLSIAREWNELLLESIRHDFARPTVHARNLYHISAAMWDAWAAYDATAVGVFNHEKPTITGAVPVKTLREETISYAAYQVLRSRFASSPGAATMFPQYDALMATAGYSTALVSTVGNTPSALGNRIAVAVLSHGLGDNANEQGNYVNQHYQPINPPLVPALPGNPTIVDPNRWQPLALQFFQDQGGIIIGAYPEFLSPEWGQVKPFSLTNNDLTIYSRDGFDYWVYHDPGPPAYIGSSTDEDYKFGYSLVSTWSSHLDPTDGVMIDVSPGSIGQAVLPNGPDDYDQFYDILEGGDGSPGYATNPVTGLPYVPQIVPRGDYARILAEFWADGPSSETPPGHWFTILNYVSDHPLTVKKLQGQGAVLDDLEWDVKAYLALGGAMHDCAIAAWGVKGWYDYLRPVSAIRYMADKGQSSNPALPSYDPDGIPLIPGKIELVTSATTAIGQKHEHLFGYEGKIALLAWRGPDYIIDPAIDEAGVGWILAENWWPYQRPSFVTPPFAGYVSGHSTFSRAAAIIMDRLTGSPYFPGGLGEFFCPKNAFLVFEEGPSVDVTLQWASYYDASDQCSLSRIWGGIHPPADDIPGRKIGEEIGPEAFDQMLAYVDGTACQVPNSIHLYGNGCPGQSNIVPKLSMAGCATDGGVVDLAITSARPQTLGILLAGFIETAVPTVGSCTLNVAPVVAAITVPIGGTLGVPGSGTLLAPLVVPGASVAGATLKFQAFIADDTKPWGFSATNGVSISIQ